MIYVTGDTHAKFTRLLTWLKIPQLTAEDYLIICGDFGGVWDRSESQQDELDMLECLPYTILFVDGNHENYDLLATYPVTEWHGGKVQFIRDNIIHLMRGQVYEIDDKTFFTMGGAASHDIYNGVLNVEDADFEKKYDLLRRGLKFYRINHITWWQQEMPSQAEMDEAWQNLQAHEMKVDYVLTHCAPTKLQHRIQNRIGDTSHAQDALTDFLQRVYDECSFDKWFCGHYHQTMTFDDRFYVLYQPIVAIETPEVVEAKALDVYLEDVLETNSKEDS